MPKRFLGIIFVAIVLIGLGYILINRTTISQSTPPDSPPSNSSQQTQTISPADAEKVSELKAGGSSFSDPKGIYTFLYPNDYKQDEQNNGQYIRVYKTGPTQQGQTEMYDGVIVYFEGLSLNNQSLSDYIDQTIQTATSDGTTTVEAPKKSIMLNGYPGFTYTLRGLGTATHIVIQKDISSNYGVSITQSVNDPENVGFQKEVDAILATVELAK